MGDPAVTVRFRLREVLEEREQAGDAMSQSELARRSGLSLSIVNAIVQHRQRQVSLETLNKLCTTLGVVPGDLFEFDPEKPKRRKSA
jgi:DNA-binding Xre family transcriptional regulator